MILNFQSERSASTFQSKLWHLVADEQLWLWLVLMWGRLLNCLLLFLPSCPRPTNDQYSEQLEARLLIFWGIWSAFGAAWFILYQYLLWSACSSPPIHPTTNTFLVISPQNHQCSVHRGWELPVSPAFLFLKVGWWKEPLRKEPKSNLFHIGGW